MYLTLKEVYEELEYLVKPVVREDIRIQRSKILNVMDSLRTNGTTSEGNDDN